jgi:hypothetical protein
MPSRFQEKLRILRQTIETSRAGLKWESDEDDRLLYMVSNGNSFSDIAKILQRSEGSIKTHLTLYALNKMEKENMSLEQVVDLVKLSEKDITDFQERQSLREERKQQHVANKSVNNHTRSNVSLVDVYDFLKIIDRKLTNLSR